MDCPRSKLDMRPATRHLRVRWRCLVLSACAGCARSRLRRRRSPDARPPAGRGHRRIRARRTGSRISACGRRSLEVERATAALDEARARYFPDSRTRGALFEVRRRPHHRDAARDHAQSRLPDAERNADGAGTAAAFPGGAERNHRLPARDASRTRASRCACRCIAPAIPAAVRAQRELLGASEYSRTGAGAPPQARHHRRLPALAGGRCATRASSTPAWRCSTKTCASTNRCSATARSRRTRCCARAPNCCRSTQQSRDAQNLAAQAQSYLNFLLNRPLDTPLENAEVEANVSATTRALAELRQAALDNRPEIAELTHLTRASEAQTSVAKAELLADAVARRRWRHPGRGIRIRPRQQLLHGVAAAQLDLFDGGARRAAVRQVRRDRAPHRDATRRTHPAGAARGPAVARPAQHQRRLAGHRRCARRGRARRASASPAASATKASISQVEFIDARSSLTGAELNLNVTRFEVLARQAELDYATAAGTLPAGCLHQCELEQRWYSSSRASIGRLRRQRCAAGRASRRRCASSRPARDRRCRPSTPTASSSPNTRCACRSRWVASCAASTCRKATSSSRASASPKSS